MLNFKLSKKEIFNNFYYRVLFNYFRVKFHEYIVLFEENKVYKIFLQKFIHFDQN